VIGVLAVDGGPLAACAPLVAMPGFARVEAAAQVRGLRALVCGTSDSDAGRAIENEARRAASAAGIAVAAIEDYAGNYHHLAGAATALLVVESEQAAALQRMRLGANCPPLGVCPSPRFDHLRRGSSALRQAYGKRDRGQRRVLWIGQPETDDALAALACVMPAVSALRLELLFRAHPRDAGYRAGRYAGLAMRDVTGLALEECLALHPELVLTQFSSVAVEAGLHGIPTLHVLLADHGGGTLLKRKGYAVPLSCAAGAGFLIDRPELANDVLARAVEDDAARATVMAAFDRYYEPAAETLNRLLAHLYNQGITKD
jgi:hypothetical protein